MLKKNVGVNTRKSDEISVVKLVVKSKKDYFCKSYKVKVLYNEYYKK